MLPWRSWQEFKPRIPKAGVRTRPQIGGWLAPGIARLTPASMPYRPLVLTEPSSRPPASWRTLVEGPAHGVWEPRKGGAVLTFEVFEFDPDGNEIGRVRVRNFIRLTDENNFVSDYAIDFIELNGDVIPDLATGSFTGKRMQVRPACRKCRGGTPWPPPSISGPRRSSQ